MHSNVDDRRRIEQAESIIRGLGWGRKTVIVKINARFLYHQEVIPKNHLSISLT